MRITTAIAVAIELLAVGCGAFEVPGADAADAAPDFTANEAVTADLEVWPADTELKAWVQTVAPRIAAATGLVVRSGDGLPVFWSSRGESEEWLRVHRAPVQRVRARDGAVVKLGVTRDITLKAKRFPHATTAQLCRPSFERSCANRFA